MANNVIKLQNNEVTLHDGSIGLFEKEVMTQKYFSLEEKTFYELDEDDEWEFVFRLSDSKKFETRQAYTLLELLGDFGGFNDAIYFLISFPMSFYTSSMFN